MGKQFVEFPELDQHRYLRKSQQLENLLLDRGEWRDMSDGLIRQLQMGQRDRYKGSQEALGRMLYRILAIPLDDMCIFMKTSSQRYVNCNSRISRGLIISQEVLLNSE